MSETSEKKKWEQKMLETSENLWIRFIFIASFLELSQFSSLRRKPEANKDFSFSDLQNVNGSLRGSPSKII